MEKGFQQLKVWEKSHSLVLDIYKNTKSFPSEEQYCLTNQIRRSAISVAANIAEGCSKTTKEFLRFLDISHASLQETKYHLILSKDLGYISSNQFSSMMDMANEIGKMLYGLKKSLH